LEKAGRLQFVGSLPTTAAQCAAAGDRMMFSGDGTHPYRETGHVLYLEAIARAWPLLAAVPATPRTLPAPLDEANWSRAAMASVADLHRLGAWKRQDRKSPQVRGATVDSRVQGLMWDDLPWTATRAGDALVFRFKGTRFGFSGLKGPDAGQFRVTIDNLPPVTDALFDSYCTPGRWRIKPWYYPRSLPDAEHTVRIELLGAAPDKSHLVRSNGPEAFAPAVLHVLDVFCAGEMVLPRAHSWGWDALLESLPSSRSADRKRGAHR
jgi:hypothetical protein